MPFILQDKTPLIATEKIDGTSTTWLLVRKPFGKFEFYVCSRNVRMWKPDQACFNGNAFGTFITGLFGSDDHCDAYDE